MVGRRKLPDPSLNHIFNALSIGVQYTLSFQLTNFGLKCLIQWTEVAYSTACNFNNSWPIYLNFSNMINFCPNIWSIESFKCQQFVFWKRSRQKTQIFYILKGRFFVMGFPIDMNLCGLVWNSCGHSKRCGFCNFSRNISKVMSIRISKVGQNSTAFKK